MLYGPEMAATELWRTRLVNKAKMVELEYPDPRGEHYFALPIEPTEDDVWPELLPFEQMERLQEEVGGGTAYDAPVVSSWLKVVLTI